MKIILVTLGKSNPERMNGVNKMVYQLASDLTPRGHYMEVWGITRQDTAEENRPYSLKLFQGNHRSFLLPDEIKKQIDALDRHTIIHFHGVMTPSYYAMAKRLRAKNIDYVVTPHGAFQKNSLQRNCFIKSLYIALFEKRFLNYAKTIQAITNAEIDAIRRLTDTKIVLVPNAYQDPEKRISMPDDLVFGYIGRLDKQHKGVDILVQAFRLYQEQGGKGRLHIIGEGKDSHSLKKSCVGLPVNFLGELHGDRKWEAINGISLFCYPSRWDVLPTSALETSLYAKPFITSTETGLEKYAAQWNAGLVLQHYNLSHLAALLHQAERCHDNETLVQMGENARRMVKDQFSWHKVSPLIIHDLYGMPR